MKLINININGYFHMIPLWKSPIKLPVELPVELSSTALLTAESLQTIPRNRQLETQLPLHNSTVEIHGNP